ncbi:MAG TPA: hypothetical protein VMW56_16895 [Candidatus Margulisiibacteriota bacterium]|nr:hypothetical protein [Candidatus Margulisiibacteriota bacterium]
MVRKAVVAGAALCVLAQTAWAAGNAKETSYWSDAGYGTLAVVANVFYMPVKVVYGTLGLVTGSLAYVLTVGDSDTAQRVWSPSLGGAYVVTPAMLRGDEPVLFNGPSYSPN